MEEILHSYKIFMKVTKIVTDNARNFVKAVRVGFNTLYSLEENNNPTETSSDSDDCEEIESEFEIVPLTELLTQGVSNLPLHQRCGAHNFNLTMTKDIEMARKKLTDKDEDTLGHTYFETFDEVIDKCKSIWNKQSRSTLIADLIKEKLGVYLQTPVLTRWNSLLSCVKQLFKLLKEEPSDMRLIFLQLKTDELSFREIDFLEDYLSVSCI